MLGGLVRALRLSQKEERNKRQARTKCLLRRGQGNKEHSAVPGSPGRPLLSESHAVDVDRGERAAAAGQITEGIYSRRAIHRGWLMFSAQTHTQRVFTEKGLPFTRVNMHVLGQ